MSIEHTDSHALDSAIRNWRTAEELRDVANWATNFGENVVLGSEDERNHAIDKALDMMGVARQNFNIFLGLELRPSTMRYDSASFVYWAFNMTPEEANAQAIRKNADDLTNTVKNLEDMSLGPLSNSGKEAGTIVYVEKIADAFLATAEEHLSRGDYALIDLVK